MPDQVTEETRSIYKTFYHQLGKVLPCSKCRNNYARHLIELPIDLYLYDKKTLFAWTVMLHNIVNKETGKKAEWTVEQAYEYYTKGKYAVPKAKKEENVDIVSVLLLLNAIMFVTLLTVFLYKIMK
jgi:hypothetical protein